MIPLQLVWYKNNIAFTYISHVLHTGGFTVDPKNRNVQTWNIRLFPVTLWDLSRESGSNTVFQQANSSFSLYGCCSLQVPPCCSCTGLTNSCSRIFLEKL